MNTESSSNVLPPVSELLRQSWDTFKKSWLHLFVFNLVAYVVLGLVIGVGVLLVVLSGVGAAMSAQQNNFALSGGLAIIAGLGGLAFLVFVIAWSFVLAAGDILIVSENGKISLDATIKRSIPFILPLFLTGIVVIFLFIGGYFAFLIPGIVFAIFFYFYMYEVVLENKKGLAALRSSMSIVTQNFWGIFGRLLLLIVIIIAFELVIILAGGLISLPILLLGKSSIAGGILYLLIQIVSYVIGSVLGFFILSYHYTLYRHAKSAAEDKKGSLLVPTIIAVIGWVIGILIILAAGPAISEAIKSGVFQKEMQNTKTQTSIQKTGNKNSPADELIKAGQLKLSTANQLAEKVNLTADDKAQIRGLINGALDDFNSATEKDPNNYLAWFYRGEAYKNLIGVTSNANDFAIESYKKAIELNSNDSGVYLALGGIYYQMKDYDNAILNFQQVVKLQPEYANGYYNLGVAYKQVGAKTEARKAIQKALDLLPKDDPTRYRADAELQGL